MLLCLFLLAGPGLGHGTDAHQIVLQNTMAVLPCPQRGGDVTWSRFISGEMVILVTIERGNEKRNDKRFGSQADDSLVIREVTASDSAMYFCNGGKVYLEVTTDPSRVPKAGHVPTDHGVGFGPGQEGVTAAADEKQQPSDLWKVPVGVVVGAAVVLLVVFTLRLCSNKRGQKKTDVDKAVAEVIYEEIQGGREQLRRDSDVESPYYWTPVSETPATSTPANNNLYCAVNKLRTAGRSGEECVYYLAQNPPQTGGVREEPASTAPRLHPTGAPIKHTNHFI